MYVIDVKDKNRILVPSLEETCPKYLRSGNNLYIHIYTFTFYCFLENYLSKYMQEKSKFKVTGHSKIKFFC